MNALSKFLSRLPRPALQVETLLLLGMLFIAALANGSFWSALLALRPVAGIANWIFLGALFVALTALHFVVFGLFATRRTVRPLLTFAFLASGITAYYMRRYGVVVDTTMLRNVVNTDWREASELLSPDFALFMLLVAIPIAAIWCVRPISRPLRRAIPIRAAWLLIVFFIGTGALLAVFQDFSAIMREQRNLRYMVTPGNVLWSSAQMAVSGSHIATREPAEPAQRLLPAATSRKPTLLVLVVGETARAQNFSLNGYARDTNPELAKLDIVNFPSVTSCGTSTEVSLPCMFSPFGRADYDEQRIRNHESLLHLAARAGMTVTWLDNQSGCKGVCDGLDFQDVSHDKVPGLCVDDHCLDGILLERLKRTVALPTDRLVVLHQLGNHGPAYFRRYPDEFKRFNPACEDKDLGACKREEIVNAYDNAIAYTDHVLAETIAFLKTQQDRYDVALVYVSDHGESLGEHGLFLHGVPYAIAPAEQTHVPMVWWLPPASAASFKVDGICLRNEAGRELSHDNLFSSVLGLLRIDTPRYRSERDIFTACRQTRRVASDGAGAA